MNLDYGVDSKVYSDSDKLEDIMYTIGKVAPLAGVSADTLRYYEKEGLIKRNNGRNQRPSLTDLQRTQQSSLSSFCFICRPLYGWVRTMI